MNKLGMALCAAFVALAACDGSSGSHASPREDDKVPGVPHGSKGEHSRDPGLHRVEGEIDDANARLDELEKPKPCVGDGCPREGRRKVVKAFGGVIDALCKHEVQCCDQGELSYKFGTALRSADDCKATFLSLLDNGATPDFIESGVVTTLVDVIRALDAPHTTTEIDAEGVAACAASLGRQSCLAPAEQGPSVPTVCSPGAPEPDPCDLGQLLRGVGDEGELCGGYVPECGEGLVCRGDGLCGTRAERDDPCQSDADCDDLYCDNRKGTCQPRRKLGESCAYVDPTFEHLDPSPPYFSRGALAHPCESGLACDAQSRTCVAACSAGTFCHDTSECALDLACHPAKGKLADYRLGLCGARLTLGAACSNADECKSGVCGAEGPGDETTCIAARPMGAPCASQGSDDTCASSYCDADLKCAPICDCEGDACPPGAHTCPSGFRCDFHEAPFARLGERLCVALSPLGNACVFGSECASGFCRTNQDDGTGACASKVARNKACESGLTEECSAGQYCSGGYVCRDYAEAGESCEGLECLPSLSCLSPGETAPSTCYALGQYELGFSCGADAHCKSGYCSSASNVCATPLKLGSSCSNQHTGDDGGCGTGRYCDAKRFDTVGVCRVRSNVGEPCDPEGNAAQCVDSSYCHFRHGTFMCADREHPTGTALCDGL